MLKTVNLNVIIIIVLLLLVIIILSSIKSCENGDKKDNRRFIDKKYTYVSEPFESDTPVVISEGALPEVSREESNSQEVPSIYDLLADQEINRQSSLMAAQVKRNLEIQSLTDDISSLENKINVMKQYVE